MNYKILTLMGMPFNRVFDFDWMGYFIGIGGNQIGCIKQVSKFDYSEKKHVDMFYNVWSNFDNCIYFYHTSDDKIFKLEIETFEITPITGHLFPEYKWEDLICYYNFLSKQYEIFNMHDFKVFEFKFEHPIFLNFINSGLLLSSKVEKTNNWLQCLDPNGGREKWRLDFDWHISQIQTFKDTIVLNYFSYKPRTDEGFEGVIDWYNPERFTIVLDGETGKEIWSMPHNSQTVDKENGVVLLERINDYDVQYGKIRSLTVFEVHLLTGKILTEVEVNPINTWGLNYRLDFVDTDAIYYRSNKGAIGKLRKTDGVIEWEFFLIDMKGTKRKVGDWLLLGNGKFVLQTEPNHKNGNLTCIFDAEENIDFTHIKNGVLII